MKSKSKTTIKKKGVISSYSTASEIERQPLKRHGASTVGDGDKLAPTPPGKILKERLMEPYGLSANKLAKALGVSPTCVAEIIRGDREITTNTAARLGRYFGTSPEFWLNLQMRYDIEKAEDANLFQMINETVPVFKPTL